MVRNRSSSAAISAAKQRQPSSSRTSRERHASATWRSALHAESLRAWHARCDDALEDDASPGVGGAFSAWPGRLRRRDERELSGMMRNERGMVTILAVGCHRGKSAAVTARVIKRAPHAKSVLFETVLGPSRAARRSPNRPGQSRGHVYSYGRSSPTKRRPKPAYGCRRVSYSCA